MISEKREVTPNLNRHSHNMAPQIEQLQAKLQGHLHKIGQTVGDPPA